MNELPQLRSCNYANTSYSLGNDTSLTALSNPDLSQYATTWTHPNQLDISTTISNQETPMSNRRIVQVFIVDPNENIPLEKSLLHQSEEPFLTDLTDQELFFEIDIKGILEKHNEYRVTVTDKDESSRDNQIKLEKAKIRDLKMVVTQVAQF